MTDTREALEIISKAKQIAYSKCLSFSNIEVAISGGADSDIMLDLLLQVCPKEKLHFVFFDTGIEYAPTKRHLEYLEKHYDIKIDKVKAKVPVPLGCKIYGVPFLTKYVSQMIGRLQNHNFDFEHDGNKSFDFLISKYQHCTSALKWWCNKNAVKKGKTTQYNIDSIKWLKEFLIENPPTFKISDKCCYGAKKNSSKDYESVRDFDCKCMGIRKSEGGIRTLNYKTCFTYKPKEKMQNFRPIFWFQDKDKKVYAEEYSVKHSECYTKYGMKRTGCAGCPFNSQFDEDLLLIEKCEPKLYKAVCNIFGESYKYTRHYKEYKARKKLEEKQAKGQINFFDKIGG